MRIWTINTAIGQRDQTLGEPLEVLEPPAWSFLSASSVPRVQKRGDLRQTLFPPTLFATYCEVSYKFTMEISDAIQLLLPSGF